MADQGISEMTKQEHDFYWNSYQQVLLYLKQETNFKPQHIVEWGAGKSTALMAKLWPNAQILSIEHDKIWYKRISDATADLPNVTVEHWTLEQGKSKGYASAPCWRGTQYDLAFIDGRMRADCLYVATQWVRVTGLTILHDTHRESYLTNVDKLLHWQNYPEIRTAVFGNLPMMETFKAQGWQNEHSNNSSL